MLQKAFQHQRFHVNISSSDHLLQKIQNQIQKIEINEVKNCLHLLSRILNTKLSLYYFLTLCFWAERKNKQIRPITPVWDNSGFVFSPLYG